VSVAAARQRSIGDEWHVTIATLHSRRRQATWPVVGGAGVLGLSLGLCWTLLLGRLAVAIVAALVALFVAALAALAVVVRLRLCLRRL
jgi:hypothetical protein